MTAHGGGRERKTKRWGVGVSVHQELSLDSKKSFMLLLNTFKSENDSSYFILKWANQVLVLIVVEDTWF